MSMQTLALVEKSSLRAEVPQFQIGDTVDVHTRIGGPTRPATSALRWS